MSDLVTLLDRYRPQGDAETADIQRVRALTQATADLAPWPDAQIKHVVIVNVPPGKGEPAHEHADVRYFMATQAPDAIRPESPHAPLRWLSLKAAHDLTSEPNLRETLARIESLLVWYGPGSE